jgi:hypothetical protein
VSELKSVGEVARAIGQGARAVDITALFYRGSLREDLCPMVGGRRMVPDSYVHMIEAALRRAGKLALSKEAT